MLRILHALRINRTYITRAYCTSHTYTPHRYGGHFTEKGYNALGLSNLHNCWVRNVRITNSDFGIKAGNTNFCTFDNIVVDVTASRGSTNGVRGSFLVLRLLGLTSVLASLTFFLTFLRLFQPDRPFSRLPVPWPPTALCPAV